MAGPSPNAPPPTLLGGRFELRATLGTGGAGVVYRAFDRTLGREVALKRLRTTSGRDLVRFKREFRALADLAHPNLIALHELHAIDDDWLFTMELVEGVGFIDWVRPGELHGPQRTRADVIAAPLDEGRLRGALAQLATGLIALHDAQQLHRDLKPSNVLVTPQGRVVLLDFGLVAGLAPDDAADGDRLAVGTPAYMSPEQAADLPLDAASDWYSLGAMLYEALTGRRPFEGASEQVMARKQTETPAAPATLAPAAPVDLARLAMALLQPEPRLRPIGTAVLEQLGVTPTRTRRVSLGQLPSAFLGRARELEQLRAALADSRRHTVAVLVKGRSGLGKSTLVRRFAAELGAAATFIQGRCFEREAVPFKMLDGVVDTLSAALLRLTVAQVDALAPRELPSLLRLFPVLRRVPRFTELAAGAGAAAAPPGDPQELRRRAFAALRQIIARLARVRPVVLFVDDAHWGDTDSAGFLADLVHGETSGQNLPGLLVVIAHRHEDYLGIVATLRRAPGGSARRGDVRELELAALGDGDATALVGQLAAASGIALDPTITASMVAAAQGNPLVLGELARADLADADIPEMTPRTVDQLVRARVVKLPVDAQAMLAVSSIAARPIPIAIAAHAAGIVGGHDVAALLSRERLATLRGVGDAMIVHPAHDYVRVAVLGGLDVEGKAAWHEALARAFEEVQADRVDSQAIVEHWLAAGHPGNAAHHAVAAAQAAEEALAFLRAAELYRIALDYGPWDAVGQRDLLRHQAHALTCAGQLDEAATIYAHAAQLLPDEEAIDLERLRVEQLLRRGRLDDALPAAERLLAQVGVRLPLEQRQARSRLASLWQQMRLRGDKLVVRPLDTIPPAELLKVDVLYSIASGLAFVDPELGRVVQTEHLRAALDSGEPVRACLALAQEIGYAAAAGSKNRAAVEGLGRRIAALAADIDHPHVRGIVALATGFAAHLAGRWRDARAEIESGLATLREYGTGVRWELDIGEGYWLVTLFYLGDWREMARLVQLHLREAIDRGDAVAQQGLRAGRTNVAWLVVDKPDVARAHLATAEAALGQAATLAHAHVALARAHVALYTGEAAAAGAIVDAAQPAFERIGIPRIQLARIELAILRARIAIADASRPLGARLAELRGHVDALAREGAPWLGGIVTALRGVGQTAIGDVDQAAATFAIAEQQLAQAGMVGLAQVARLRAGELEGGPIGVAKALAARDVLAELGAVSPERLAQLLIPLPP